MVYYVPQSQNVPVLVTTAQQLIEDNKCKPCIQVAGKGKKKKHKTKDHAKSEDNANKKIPPHATSKDDATTTDDAKPRKKRTRHRKKKQASSNIEHNIFSAGRAQGRYFGLG